MEKLEPYKNDAAQASLGDASSLEIHYNSTAIWELYWRCEEGGSLNRKYQCSQVEASNMSDLLKSLVFEMDSAMGSVSSRVGILHDVEVRMGYLREDMDTAEHKGEQRLYYRDHHREVRVLSELLYYLTKDLIAASETAYNLHLSIFANVVKDKAEDLK
jgi:hypothetical protein